MKKTITVNLNGRVFTMDEDAYRLLDNYLNNLRIYFRKEEGGSEIIADFEARIEELLSEKTRLGYQVITIEHVEEVIARVGKPGDFTDKEDAEEEKQTYFTESKEVKKKFFRNIDDKMFGGICSGIAAYFGWDVVAVRIIFIILIFATSFWIVPFYLLAWIIFPAACTAEQKLQMSGKPITVENIGKTVAAEVESTTVNESKGCLTGFVDLCVGLMKVFLIGLGCLVGIPLLFTFVIVVIVLIALLFGIGGGIMGIVPSFMIVDHPIWATTTLLLVVGIPTVALIYALIAHFVNLKPLNRAVKWVFLIIWILALVLFLFSGFRIQIDRKTIWNQPWSYSSSVIHGNNSPSHKTIDFGEPIKYLDIRNYLCANIQIEQTENETPSIEIDGDENLVEQVRCEQKDNWLILSATNRLRCDNNLNITLRTNDLYRILMRSTGNVLINRAFTASDQLSIELNGVGNFHADSLYVNSLTVRSEGIGSSNISGKANKARFETSGAGKIDAMELVVDTVYASVKGIGSIRCNPTEYLKGDLEGVGKITYKDEPKNKDIDLDGIGKVGKE